MRRAIFSAAIFSGSDPEQHIKKSAVRRTFCVSERYYISLRNIASNSASVAGRGLPGAQASAAAAKEWVKILQSMGIITLLEPYSSNELKRLIKTPKLYFCDTGLCAYLSSWTSRDVLMNGAAAGHYYENHVVGEFVRNVAYGKNKVNLNFYRDQNMKEIDLIAEENGVLHPVEVKKASEPDRKLLRAFSVLKETEKHVGNGGIVCMTDMPLPIDEKNSFIPSNII